jgi:endonuclease YncB( thermonuclease family)
MRSFHAVGSILITGARFGAAAIHDKIRRSVLVRADEKVRFRWSPCKATQDSVVRFEHKKTSSPVQRFGAALSTSAALFLLLTLSGPATASECTLERQGEGRVAAVVDPRSFRLDDGREIRLAGIEGSEFGRAALAAMVVGHDVTLHGDDDSPDRYGRQSAIVFVAGAERSVQSELLRRGEALASIDITDKNCAAALTAAERAGRDARLGIWAERSAIKNAESSGDILAEVGRFAVVEGRVLSVRQAGAITYLNFGRNWTRDFAATIPKRIIPAFEGANLGPKWLENRRIRVRGVVSARGGPRIELLRVGQVEVLGGT